MRNMNVTSVAPPASVVSTHPAGVPLDALIVSCVALVILTVVAGWLLDLDWPTMRTTLLIAFALPWLAIGCGALWRLGVWVVPQIETRFHVDLNGDGHVGPVTRLVPVRGVGVSAWGTESSLAPAPDLLDAGGGAVERADVYAFVQTAVNTGDWTRRAWVGQRLPSGRECDAEYHAALVRFLTAFEVVKDYGERKRGQLVTTDAGEALRMCGLV